RERWIAGEIHSEHQRIEEQAEHFFQFRTIAARRYSTHHHVFLAGIAVEHGYETCQQRHEESYSVLLAEIPKCCGKVSRQRDRMHGPPMRLDSGPSPVAG